LPSLRSFLNFFSISICRIWKENSIAKKFSPQAAELYRSAFTLRQRMMNAIQNLEYYMMIEIIEPNWHIFIEKMKKVENVDNVLRLHQDFLDSCLKNCMLTESSEMNRSIFKLCNVCLKFCDFIQVSPPGEGAMCSLILWLLPACASLVQLSCLVPCSAFTLSVCLHFSRLPTPPNPNPFPMPISALAAFLPGRRAQVDGM